ncbi:MAG: hypothetical protein U0168_13200 [Nannocystaceae bacterium]
MAHRVGVAGVDSQRVEDGVASEVVVLALAGREQDLRGLDQQRRLQVLVGGVAGGPQAQRRQRAAIALQPQQHLELVAHDRILGRGLEGLLVGVPGGLEAGGVGQVQPRQRDPGERAAGTGAALRGGLEHAHEVGQIVVRDQQPSRALEREAVIGLVRERGAVVLQRRVLAPQLELVVDAALPRAGLGQQAQAIVVVGRGRDAARRILGPQQVVGRLEPARGGQQLQQRLARRGEIGVGVVGDVELLDGAVEVADLVDVDPRGP